MKCIMEIGFWLLFDNFPDHFISVYYCLKEISHIYLKFKEHYLPQCKYSKY